MEDEGHRVARDLKEVAEGFIFLLSSPFFLV
jgi:hypothetical protein